MRIEAEKIHELRNRFYDFYDGVVRALRFDLRPGQETCEIDIEAMDRESTSGWSNVRLTVKNVSEYRFARGRTMFDVLSSGIQFAWRAESIYVVLDAYPDDGTDLPDLSTNIAYVVGTSCDLDVSEIPS